MLRQICLSALTFISILATASWTPVVHNYAVKDYQAGTQNWGIAEQENGWIYVANNYGLLEYDGSHWNLYGLSNSTAVRCVTVGDDHKVYAGGRNQYGYFQSNHLGGMDYTSLSDSLPNIYKNFGEVWRIIYHQGNLYIHTRQWLICHIDGQIQIIDPGAIIEAIAMVNGSLYVATNRDIFILVGNRLHTLPESNLLHGFVVSQMIDLNGDLLIATDCNGLFLYNGETIQPFHTEIDQQIRQAQIYSMTTYNNYLVIGTVQRGLLITMKDGHGCYHITRDEGLQNNTVLSLCIDQHQHLWAGLDRGISRISISLDVFFLNDKIDYGSGYAFCSYHGENYLGTNHGLYYQAKRNADLEFIDGSQGQVWSLDIAGSTLFCSHNKGLYEIDHHRLIPILAEGCWRVRELSPTEAIVGTYNGFYLLQKHNHQWKTYRLNGFDETTFNFNIEPSKQVLLVPQHDNTVRLHIDLSAHQLIRLPADTILSSLPPQGMPWNFLDEQHLLIDGFYNSFLSPDSFFIIGSLDGFYCFRLNSPSQYSQQLYIRQIAVTNPYSQVIYGEGYATTQSSPITLTPGKYTLHVLFAGNNASKVPPRFATRLWPDEKEFTAYSSTPSRDLTGLHPGHYRLDVQMLDGLSGQICTRSIDITIQWPFYERWWAICIYLLLLGAIVYYIFYRVREYVQEKSRRIQLESDHELQQQQMQILQLEKNQTQNKLKNKSQELSHMLLSEVNRKEWAQGVLTDLRRIVDLLQADNYDEVKTRIQALQTKLTRNTQSGLDWKRFETNFDLVHEQFIAHLKEKYPWMSKQEQQLCIYIKMGLLTKEIAPLMNISVRGVEMLRYRMRQKMDMPESANIKKELEQL